MCSTIGAACQLTDPVRVGAEILKGRFNDFSGTGTDLQATTGSLKVSCTF